MNLSDQNDRDRFAGETGKNFSVIAPAGVGKTTAIVKRVVEVARAIMRAREAGTTPPQSHLVVVTYTRKAADELRDRARGELVSTGLPSSMLGWFNEVFFGTIHSFCLELLRRFGPLAGLPTQFTVEMEDAALHLAFQRDTADVAAFLPESARAPWRRYGEASAIWTLAWSWPVHAVRPPAPGRCPPVEPALLIEFKPKRKDKRTEKNIHLSLERLRRWLAAPGDARALGLPEASGGGDEFETLWAETFQPLREWLAVAAAHAAAGLAEAFILFKESQGRLRYDDFMRLAARLLRDPVLAERIRAEEFSVLLDEAQDTDPAQFAVLAGVAQPLGAPGLWMEGQGAPPAPGRFSMVGDSQQSIYDRADVRAYRNLHDALLKAGAAEELKFSVTMRCDEAIVAGVNEIFPGLLHGESGQANFVQLQSRPKAGAGGIWRLPVARPENFGAKPKVAERIRGEADALARWLAKTGPAGVGADDWKQVAILSPRKDWLGALAAALEAAHLPNQVHSSNHGASDDPARAWLGAMLGVLADPADAFEITGVLREVFGISDDEIYRWRCLTGGGQSLQLNVVPQTEATGPVAAALLLLRELQHATVGRPLRDTVALAVEATQLRERLVALPLPAVTLEALLDQAALADARGDTLAAFARELRQGPAEVAELVAQAGKVQLLTFHKAKGLEWPAVILFGMFREPGFASPEYPMWRPAEDPGAPPACLYDKFHPSAGSWKSVLAAQRRASFARLLYVSATRPKHSLIVVDASTLGADKGSLADVLGFLPGGPAHEWWKNLPTSDVPLPKPDETASATLSMPKSAPFWGPVGLPQISFREAKVRAEKFPRRVRPSALARHTAAIAVERAEPDLFAPPDYPEEQSPPTAAMDYGNWWHDTMEHTPWAAGRDAWAAHWEKRSEAAPDPARARDETARFLKSPLAACLATPGLEFVAEMPFLWPEPGGARAYDGCVDLAVWDASAGRWLVIDWKTDRVEGDPAAELRRRYGPQLEVYARALGAAFSAPVEAFLYGTRAGVLAAL